MEHGIQCTVAMSCMHLCVGGKGGLIVCAHDYIIIVLLGNHAG